MITPQEMEELRQDCLTSLKEEEQHKCLMRSDLHYFLNHSNYPSVVQELIAWKKQAKMYDRCIYELMDIVKDEL